MNQIISNTLISSSIILHIGISFYIIFTTIRFFHLAHGAIFLAGAYTAVFCFNMYDRFDHVSNLNGRPILVFIIAILIAILISSLIGFLVNEIFYKPLRRRKASNLIFLLCSFGLFIFLTNLITLYFGNQNYSLRDGPIVEGYHLLGMIYTPIQMIIILSAILLYTFIYYLIKKTKYGQAIQAVSDDYVSAMLIGIDPEKIIMLSFIIGSGLVGYSGVMISLETQLEPSLGFELLLKGVIAVIIGGIGSYRGLLFASIILGIIDSVALRYLPSGWNNVAIFVSFLLFLLFKPKGIFGMPKEREG